jgi:hypothetical protein
MFGRNRTLSSWCFTDIGATTLERMTRSRLDVEIRRHRASIKSWVLRRIADTPVFTELDTEASTWFHGLEVAERSRLITDLARVNVKGANLFEIAAGPLGAFFTKFPGLFEESKDLPDPIEIVREPEQEMALAVSTPSLFDSTEAAWYLGGLKFDSDLEGPVWPAD